MDKPIAAKKFKANDYENSNSTIVLNTTISSQTKNFNTSAISKPPP